MRRLAFILVVALLLVFPAGADAAMRNLKASGSVGSITIVTTPGSAAIDVGSATLGSYPRYWLEVRDSSGNVYGGCIGALISGTRYRIFLFSTLVTQSWNFMNGSFNTSDPGGYTWQIYPSGTVGQLIASGTATRDKTRVSMANTFAFLDLDTAVDLSPYANDGYAIALYDNANALIGMGYAKTAGTGTLADNTSATDILNGWNLQSGWSLAGESATATDTLTRNAVGAYGYATKGSVFSAGRLYCGSLNATLSSGTFYMYSNSWLYIYLTNGDSSKYFTVHNTYISCVLRHNASNGATCQVAAGATGLSAYVVNGPGATGVTITSTPGGATQSWAAKGSGNPDHVSGTKYYVYTPEALCR